MSTRSAKIVYNIKNTSISRSDAQFGAVRITHNVGMTASRKHSFDAADTGNSLRADHVGSHVLDRSSLLQLDATPSRHVLAILATKLKEA
jgi:hypothetical protein